MPDCVVVTRAKEMNYRQDYVALPKNYGRPAYFAREDVKAIYAAVFANLQELDGVVSFTPQLSLYKYILIKPNLVSVYHHAGLAKSDYPESTDPRVFDAVVAFFKQYNPNIIIVESSGKPMPTANSFRVSGINRIAKYHRTGLVALEKEPVARYMLPKAEVMREIYIPTLFEEVVRGKAFYVSVPKLKTNLYTGVTLGFKNAMGSIPYFLRERNHNYAINKKIADILYLLRPNLVVIDGIIGGEGNTPAPVDPVDVGVILSGNNAVETDLVATRMMGIDPAEIPLMREATARGFGGKEVNVIGSREPVPFRRADPSLMSDAFHQMFPKVLALAGHTLPHAPKVEDIHAVTPRLARQLEMACDGGCLAALRSGYDYVAYSPKPKYDFPLAVVIGAGVEKDGTRYWFDREGRPYSMQEVAALSLPLLTLGNCAAGMERYAKYTTAGCCNPAKCMIAATSSAGMPFPLLTPQNKAFVPFVGSVLAVVAARCWHTLRGRWVDCPSEHKDKIYDVPLPKGQEDADYIPWPLPKMDGKTKRKLLKDQLSILEM